MTELADRLAVDIIDGKFYADDPYSAWEWMRHHEPVYYDEANDIWGITKHADVRTCSTDALTFSSGVAGIRPKAYATPQMIDTDPPVHTKRRKLVSSGFTPRRIAAMIDHVDLVCDELLDAVSERGSCDFVTDIAAPLPLRMIADMLGVGADRRDDLLRWSDTMMECQGASDPALLEAAINAFSEYRGYIVPIIQSRRDAGNTDDILGILANAEIDGDRLTDDELVYETLLILVGGDETTRHVLSGGVLALLENPAQWDALRADPLKMTRAVEEALRWVSPVKNMVRTVTRDVTLSGVDLHEGNQLMLFYPSANRDEDVFSNPSVFDIDRVVNPHLAFGLGHHFCLGNQLARLELSRMFQKVIERMPDLRLAPGAELPIRPANFVSGLETMLVEYSSSAPILRARHDR